MNFRMSEDDFTYAIHRSASYSAVNEFLDKLEGAEGAALRERLYDMRDAFLAHILDKRVSQEEKDLLGKSYLCCCVFALAGPYSVYGKKLPAGLADSIGELLDTCGETDRIKEQSRLFTEAGPVSATWISAVSYESESCGLCFHGLAHFYLLAEAFVGAMERESLEKAQREAAEAWAREKISPTVRECLEEILAVERKDTGID